MKNIMEVVLNDENVIAIKNMVARASRVVAEATLESLSTPEKYKETMEAVSREINRDVEETLLLLGRESE